MNDWYRLPGAQVLELARSVVGTSPGGHEAAPELFPEPLGKDLAWADAQSSILSIPAWAGAIGAIFLGKSPLSVESRGSHPALLVVWIEPRPPSAHGFPSQLTFDLPTGRYTISTYDCEKHLAVGSETAYGPPIVCGPPFDGAAVAVLVRRWPGALPKVLGSEIHSQASRQSATSFVTSC